jgi:glycosyltransferase involved in cell wall biosynthesis
MMVVEKQRAAILHYSAPPVVGGVESVIAAHARFLVQAGFPTRVVAGRGAAEALPRGTEFTGVPEADSQHPEVLALSAELERGSLPADFDSMVERLAERLAPLLRRAGAVIVHNVFTKHFNLPLTAALCQLLDRSMLRRCIAWCHDITWTSPNSRNKVHEGYPWDLLRRPRTDVTYVTISRDRQHELAGLFGCPPEQIRVIYNGVDPGELLALSEPGAALIDRLHLWDGDVNLLMPVRVTQAKNVELALQVTAELKERGIRPKMVVTGPPDPHDPGNRQYFQSLLGLREQLGVGEHFHFVYESGPEPGKPLILDMPVVAELLRVSDALFMPSRREGFGMPVLEAGLAGIPVFCSDAVPAGREIGGGEAIIFSPNADAPEVAGLIQAWMQNSPVLRLRRRMRQEFTWRSIFQRQILPLLQPGGP